MLNICQSHFETRWTFNDTQAINEQQTRKIDGLHCICCIIFHKARFLEVIEDTIPYDIKHYSKASLRQLKQFNWFPGGTALVSR